MSNNTYQTHWNTILNALPKEQRGAYKLANIAQPERQKNGTNSYRVNNVYDDTLHSPAPHRPWKPGV